MYVVSMGGGGTPGWLIYMYSCLWGWQSSIWQEGADLSPRDEYFIGGKTLAFTDKQGK